MRNLSAVMIALGLAWASPVIAQGPPPPARMPQRIPEVLDGYRMATPYQRWRIRVERSKGEATAAALTTLPEVEGRRRIGRELMSFEYRNDFGVFLRGDVHVFCLPAEGWRFDQATCTYLYRQATVPDAAAVWGAQTNPVSRWTEENFDPAQAVATMRASGLTPTSDLWMIDDTAILDGQPSPLAVLGESLHLARIDSAGCPAMSEAIRALDAGQIGWRSDLFAVGEDQESRPPRPHAITGSFTLNLWAGTGRVTITGDDERLWNAVSPTLNAARECLQQQAG